MNKVKLLITVILLLACGCVSSPLRVNNFFLLPEMDRFNVRDVGLLPFDGSVSHGADVVSKVRDIFSSELRSRNWWRVHFIKSEDLKDLDKMAAIDAVISGEVIYYKETEPLEFGLSVRMKDFDTGQTIWSAYYIFDAASRDVVKGVRSYYHRNMFSYHPLLGYKGILISIDKFIRFGCNRIIDTLDYKTETETETETEQNITREVR